MNDTRPILEVTDLHTVLHTAGGLVQAVNTVSLRLTRGCTLALLGESGCGKSMTALSIARLLPEPAAHIIGGSVRLEDTELLDLPEYAMRRIRGRRIGMIFQEPMTALNPVLTVGDQIGEVLALHFGLRGKQRHERILALLHEVGIPEPETRIRSYPHQLSGGMKQRVGIAIALAGEPDVLIADEPTTALDVTIQNQILNLLARLQRERGMAMLMITHDLAVVQQVADNVAVMYAGEIVETASKEALFANPQHPYTRQLFQSVPTAGRRGRHLRVIKGRVPPLTTQFKGCRFADRCPFAWEACFNETPKFHLTDSGQVRCHLFAPDKARPPHAGDIDSQSADGAPPLHADSQGKPILNVTDMKVHFPIRRGVFKRTIGHVHAVDGVSLAIHPGQTLALVGESGCGKTTLGRALLQLERPTGGSVTFDGHNLCSLRGRKLRALRHHIQMIFQDPYSSMDPRMLVSDVVMEGMRAQGIGRTPAERRQRAIELLDEVGLAAGAMERYPHEFSGGQRQRIAIARALAVDPRLIVCDEPTSALDVSVQAQVLNLLRTLQHERDLAYLFISHNMAVVNYIADHVAVMYLGRIVEQGTVDDVMTSPKHPYTQALLAAAPTLEAGSTLPQGAEGEMPSPIHPPRGCHFADRCPFARPECRQAYPDITPLSDTHTVRCFLYGHDGSKGNPSHRND